MNDGAMGRRSEGANKAEAGVYVHVPFCARLCPYCAFPVALGQDGKQGDFVSALLQEAEARAGEISSPAASLNLGGGTPSRLEPSRLGTLIRGLKERLPLAPGAEFSLEANPEDLSQDKVRAWRDLGFSRVSLGVQSLDPGVLKDLGRLHSPEQVSQGFSLLRGAGFTNLGLDLIAGSSTPASAMDSLDQALRLEPSHVSFYVLEYEAGTALARDPGRRRWTGEEEAETMERAAERLAGEGFEWYEISNFARPGSRCRHNENFWLGGDVLGLGPGAASSVGPRRRRNKRNLEAWLAAPLAAGESETLDPWALSADLLIRGLRRLEGLSLSGLPLAGELEERARSGEYKDLLALEGGRLIPSPRGRLVADGLALDLMPPRRGSYSLGDEPLVRR